MESTSSSYDNTFYCPACKREYPLSSKKYHISICKGLKSVQSDNNTIKEDCGVNEWIDIHASQCYSHEEEKKSDSLPQPPILKEEDFEELQLVLDQISQEKELEEDKKKGISSELKEYRQYIEYKKKEIKNKRMWRKYSESRMYGKSWGRCWYSWSWLFA